MKYNKKYIGVVYAVIIGVLFLLIALWGRNFFNGVVWYLFSSVQRLIFGVIATMIFCRLYNKNVRQIFNFHNWKSALIAGSGFLIYAIYYAATISLGIDNIVGLTIPLIVSQIFLQQITTGFYEEIVYRGFVLEGYFEQENKDWKQRLLYASLSFCLFGLIHIVDGDLYTFFFTGILGFAFATIYIKSHNIFIPMIFHFVYDIFANMNSYIEYKSTIIFNSLNSIFDIIVAIMFIVSIIILVKENKCM